MSKEPTAYIHTGQGKALFAFGKGAYIRCNTGNALEQMDDFLAKHRNAYLFSFLGYDLKNEIEDLQSANPDGLEFPDLFCWHPEYVIEIEGENHSFLQGQPDEYALDRLGQLQTRLRQPDQSLPAIRFRNRITKEKYIAEVSAVLKEIQFGNSYELNFCQEFFAEEIPDFDSWELVKQQFKLTQAPFSAFLEFDEFQVFCGSPERFIRKEGALLSSQPIKGTIRRGKDPEEDELLKNILRNDPKERSENVMITDLVRNDLSRIAAKDSVQVDELCGIHTFATVHHMISTVSCTMAPAMRFSQILRATFPMGSMTGAPKISSMQLIEKHESFRRGLYAGSIGYFKPNGDFDFNVVIRSFLYNQEKQYLSCAVGSAITIKSDPEKEYDECMVKVKRMLQLFGDDQPF